MIHLRRLFCRAVVICQLACCWQFQRHEIVAAVKSTVDLAFLVVAQGCGLGSAIGLPWPGTPPCGITYGCHLAQLCCVCHIVCTQKQVRSWAADGKCYAATSFLPTALLSCRMVSRYGTVWHNECPPCRHATLHVVTMPITVKTRCVHSHTAPAMLCLVFLS